MASSVGEASRVSVAPATQGSLTGREARESQRGPPRAHRRHAPSYLLFPRPSAAPRDDLTHRRPIPCSAGREAPPPNDHFRGERNRERAGRAPLLRALNPHGGDAGAPPGGLASRAVPAPALNRGGGAGDAGARARLPSVRRGGGGRPRAGAGVAEGTAVIAAPGSRRGLASPAETGGSGGGGPRAGW